MQDFHLSYITLPTATERIETLQTQFDSLNLQAEPVWGLDARQGYDVSATSYLPEVRKRYGGDLLNGEVGCNEGHIRAWQAFLDSGAEFGVVLEDDAEILAGFSSAIHAVIRETRGWHVVRLERRKRGHLTNFQWRVSTGHRLMIPRNFTYGMAGMLLSRTGAETALNAARKGYWHSLDYQIGQIHRSRLTYLQLDPVVVRERPIHSLIDGTASLADSAIRQSSNRTVFQSVYNRLDRGWGSLRRRQLAMVHAHKLSDLRRQTPL